MRRRRALIALAGLGLAGAVALEVGVRAAALPAEALERIPVSREVRARDGRLVYEAVGADEQWRRPLALAEMGHWLPLATVAVEDERFRRHPGVDPLAVGRALLENLAAGRVVSGASTLSMQLARMADPRPRTVSAKGLEALRALAIERRFEKDELLEHYLNLAPFGGNLRGVSVAARRWFGRPPAELSLAEAALLAGLPQSPERLRPDRHPARARARRDHVLDRMLACGFASAGEWRRARLAPLRLEPAPRADAASHFARLALARRPAGGVTTLDLDLQRACEALARDHAVALPAGTDVALVVADVGESAVRALVGSLDARDPIDGQVNGATAWRSPGSALKPFVYAAAFESRRFAPDSWLEDAPADFGGWRPANFDRCFAGRVRAGDALRRSLNLPALRLARDTGLNRCVGVIETCGVRLRPGALARGGLALVTGAEEVRLVDLVSAYATLARGGLHRPLRLFPDERAPRTRALSGRTCAELDAILSSAVAPPNGWDRAGESRDFTWKTGTSSGRRDAWAVGHDGRYAAGVWVGRFGGAGDGAYVGRAAAEPLLTRVFQLLGASDHGAG